MMDAKRIWTRESSQVAIRSIGVYILCLGIYFIYNKTISPEKNSQLGLVPYIVITIWCAWIFVHNRLLLRKLLFRKKIVAYVLSLLVGIILSALIQRQILQSLRGVIQPLQSSLVSISFYTLIGSILFLAFLYIKERKDFYQLTTLKREVELQQLKSQLNPHFLFNSLNNIYSYNLENNTYGNDLILKLSQLMRFIVESTREDSIPLIEEINFIDNYVAFEKERLGYRCDIIYTKELGNTEKKVPPLLLFPLIENAFKHGTNTIKKSRIEIVITDTPKELTLMVKNEIVDKKKDSTKVGLSNVSRRLELLFPGKYDLDIQADADFYTVRLKLIAE